ncbi:MAG: VCBS repeat-containing protein [Pyrinomonadaceae bacterium]|nr:VCBS repeat-containing protein [Pyrinomonadaceae bacterium]
MRRIPPKFKRLQLLKGSFWVLALIACVVVISMSRRASLETRTPHMEPAPSLLKEVPRLIQATKAAGAVFSTHQLFDASTSRAADDASLRKAVNDGTVLDLNRENIQRILATDMPFLILPLPDGRGGNLELELVKVNIFAPGFTVNVASTGAVVEGHLGAHYRGIVKGDTNSLAAISVFDNEVMGFYSTRDEGNTVLGRLRGENPTDRHILYNDRDLKGTLEFTCATDDLEQAKLPTSVLPKPVEDSPDAVCVRMYVEADYNIFTDRGSIANVRNFLTGVFNQSATLYANDTIPVALSQLIIWDVPSPYGGAGSTQMLNGFIATRTAFRGDTAHLVSFRNDGGLAYVNVLCNQFTPRYGYSGLDPDFLNVPTYSWSVEVFTHEAGHNLGSPHTHACAWNGNNTAIDGCSAVEGMCPTPANPVSGGTIMSYCHLQAGVGINFTHGFGPQPKALILQRFNAAACLTDCANPLTPLKRAFDFDGDGFADLSVFRPNDGVWHLLRSGAGYTGIAFGLGTDAIAPADYDGDNRTDLGVFRNGTWYLQRSSTGFKGVAFGAAGDLPMPGDFDGDGLADISVFRPSTGTWYRLDSGTGQFAATAFGLNGDIPVMGDFDGDGRADISVFRPSNGTWYLLRSTLGFTGVQFGASGDKPVTGDYDGDGRTDIAVYRPSNGTWYLLRSTQGFTGVQFGVSTDTPVPADYDNDGRTDVAVYRSAAGTWYLLRSTAGFTGIQFGTATDRAVPAAYIP